MIIEKKSIKSDAPTCACGKVDLYEEWLKQKEEDAVSTETSRADNDISFSEEANKQDLKSGQTRK